jgi:hypothetical protein
MKNIKIFCEGVTDQIFISDCLELLYSIEMVRKPNKSDPNKLKITFGDSCEIIDVGGCSKLSDDLYVQVMLETNALDGINVVVFDADFPANAEGSKKETGNKGFNSCCQKLNDIKKKYNVEFEYLVWPNHSEDGEVEDLLKKLIPKGKEPILECINSHQECLKTLGIENLRLAELKDIIGFYLHTSYQESNVRKRNYKDSDFWNLDFEGIPDLNKIKLFFDAHLTIAK